ncbi:transmembrane protein 273 isoform X1 [Cuculus canorus]|uniref:transmembrane protein 273 isoform X1 n=1 Tax=Cuculus canorus TaxID=55661 RepID=UPI0023AAA7F3|nr:transmembrane protein 273 isoform X1 [Cuculus canorus]
MTLLTSWISVLTAFLLLLYFWRAKVYASGNSEEELDFTYVILGVTLGAFLAIGFVALIICLIKKQMIDNVFEGEVIDFVMAAKFNNFNDDLILTALMVPHSGLQAFATRSNMGSSQNRDVNVPGKQSTDDQ